IKHGRNCPIDCASVYYNGLRRSGIYSILPSVRGIPIEVLCEMDTEGPEFHGDFIEDEENFYRLHVDGFSGTVEDSFAWYHDKRSFSTPDSGNICAEISHGGWWYHQCFFSNLNGVYYKGKKFLCSRSIEDEENFYRLHVDGFSGTVEDSFAWYHDKRSFSTPDSGNICAEISHGGWWYHQCFFSNLNGVYYKGGRYSIKNRKMLGPDGIVWYSWKDTDYYSLRKVVMMIRPRAFRPHLSP
ncbi:fibrinogen-like protein 1, partial [Onychostruthus taczanowskii]|uniref:fibrinogen-like protein 1 n=1 Tax=Onychostruthus taczanowskii TaxID=356909 RepID=UPI001B809F46